MVTSRRPLAVDAVVRLASLGALGFSIALPLVILLNYATVAPVAHRFFLALAATAVYLPLQVRHVRYALRGVRPPGLPWTLIAMAVAIVAPTPTLGAYWLYAFHALAASVLVTTRRRVSAPALGCILVVVGIWGNHFGSALGRAQYVYLPAAVLDRAMTIFILVWLVGALRRVQAARLALADQALATERQRVDDELSATVGAQLGDVVRRGESTLEMLRMGASGAEAELESLFAGSRSALAEARSLIGRYKLVSSTTEIERAAALLRAAGMDVTVDIPVDALPPALDDLLRSSLRAAVAKLVAEPSTGHVVLRLGGDGSAHTIEAVADAIKEPAV